jgi:hypothetical protein
MASSWEGRHFRCEGELEAVQGRVIDAVVVVAYREERNLPHSQDKRHKELEVG